MSKDAQLLKSIRCGIECPDVARAGERGKYEALARQLAALLIGACCEVLA